MNEQPTSKPSNHGERSKQREALSKTVKFLIGLNVNEPDTFLIKFEVLKMISSTLFGVSRSHFHRLLKLEYYFNI